MNTNIKVILLVLVAILAQFAAAVGTGETNWLKIAGSIAGSLATTIGALFVRLPQKEWTEDERALKLGESK